MKKLLLYTLLIFLLNACRIEKNILITDLNAIGEVVSVKKCNSCPEGMYLYKIEISPTFKLDYLTDKELKTGEVIYFQTNIEKDEL